MPAKNSDENQKLSFLPANGRVIAFIIGIEEYQPRAQGIDKVAFAKADANGFAEALKTFYPEGRLEIYTYFDSHATLSNLSYELKSAIGSLESSDLFIFYYAGHGFHGAGGNRITAWDTHPFNIEETTLQLREALIDPLTESECEHALAFVDACGENFAPLVQNRSVVTSMNDQELKEFLQSAKFSALFLSCGPGEKSYPSQKLGHGIWTYYLLEALEGRAETALGPGRYLTDVGLRDFLKHSVKNFITRETNRQEKQTPVAHIASSSTFAIREVPKKKVSILKPGDLSFIKFSPTAEYVEGVEQGLIRSLPGFSKSRRHFEPDTINDAASSFVQGLAEEKIREEIQEAHDQLKEALGLRRKAIQLETDVGSGNIDTDHFRYTVEASQDRTEKTKYAIRRKLTIREAPDKFSDHLDSILGAVFDRIVLLGAPRSLDFEELAEAFEELAVTSKGAFKESNDGDWVSYTPVDGPTIRINVETGRLTLRSSKKLRFSELLELAQGFRFSLSPPSKIFIN
jgi:hypothetical protein